MAAVTHRTQFEDTALLPVAENMHADTAYRYWKVPAEHFAGGPWGGLHYTHIYVLGRHLQDEAVQL